MRRRLGALLLGAAGAAWAQAPLEANSALERELDGLKGLGPATTQRILQAREQRAFADWSDLMRRVPGIRGATARKLSDQGLRVNGQALAPAPSPLRPAAPAVRP